MQEQTKYAPNNYFWNYVSVGLEVVTQTYFLLVVNHFVFTIEEKKKMLHKNNHQLNNCKKMYSL